MKKLLVALCALALIAIPLFAQGGAETTTAVDDSKPITIEFWTHEDAARQALEEKYIAEYKAQHPNVTINVTRQSAEKLRELVQTAFAAGQGPTFFNLPIENEYQYIEAGRVAPADYATLGFKDAKDLIASYADGMIDAVVYDGDVYGLPLETTNWSIFINKKVFRDAGLDPETDYPKTWEDMVEVSKKIVVRDGDIITRRGFDFRYSYELTGYKPINGTQGLDFNPDWFTETRETFLRTGHYC